MNRTRFTLIAQVALAIHALSIAAYGQTQKPAFQYELENVRISIPSADEPRAPVFGPESIQLAGKYLETGAVSWARGRACVNCHTTGPYLTEYTGWSRQFGPPSEEVRASFVNAVPKKILPVKETEKDGHRYYPGAFNSVWRSLGLAEWDRHVSGKLSEETERSLADMFERQSESGAFVSHGEVEVPHITTDFELSLQAARAITAAPGWLAGLRDETVLSRVEKLKQWLRTAEPKNDFDRVLKLQLAHYLPELVTQTERDAALALLSSKQHADGGFSTRDMSPVNDWHFEMSSTVLKIIENLPDREKPESDPYMTALAVVLMRQNNVPVSDPRIQKALTWLKREQRASGRWWMHSLYRGNFHYITYIATVEAIKALDLCGELDAITADAPVARSYDPLGIDQAALAAAPLDFDVSDAERDREIPIRVYLPAKKAAAPVILFSHGLGGSRAGSRFLGQHWAARGYVAVFLQHPGSDEGVWRNQPLAGRAAAMRKAAGLQNFNLRAQDVPAVLDQLEKWNQATDHALAGRLDFSQVGMSGHSFGAITTQAVSGQSFPLIGTSLTDARIKAALVLSPSRPASGDVNKAFADVKIPWLLMTGTKDIASLGGAPIGVADMASRLAVFPALRAGNKYELVLDGAEHSVFTDRALPGESGQRNPKHHRIILALSTAFWDAYLRGDSQAQGWLDGDGPRRVLDEKDQWQRK